MQPPDAFKRQRLTAGVLKEHTTHTRRVARRDGITDLTGRQKQDDEMSQLYGMTAITGKTKFERAIERGDCQKIMMGVNMSDAFIGIKRARTTAEKESPEAWYPKLEKHFKLMVSAQELNLPQMLDRLDYEKTLDHWNHVESGLQEDMPKCVCINLVLCKAF